MPALFSPSGVVYYVRDANDARKLAEAHEITARNLYGLCGWQGKQDGQTEGWQRVDSTQWVSYQSTLLPVVGGSARAFLELHKGRFNINELDAARLGQLLKGTLKTTKRENGKQLKVPTDTYKGWRRAAAPANIFEFLRDYHAPPPFAPPINSSCRVGCL